MATRPPELSMDAKWEAAIDLTLRRLVYGSLAGGAAGLLLFRACTYNDILLFFARPLTVFTPRSLCRLREAVREPRPTQASPAGRLMMSRPGGFGLVVLPFVFSVCVHMTDVA